MVVQGEEGLKVVDVNKAQAQSKLATNRLVDRYNRLYQSSQTLGYNQQSSYFTQKLILFGDYEAMDQDPIIHTALDIYADESTTADEFGDILSVRSNKSDIEETLRNLFYNVLNIDFNLWMWTRSMCKYGDFYLKLDITEDLGVVGVTPLSSYEMMREEGTDPNRPEYVRFKHDPSIGGQAMSVGPVGKVSGTIYESYEIAHFRLLADANFLPYGKSMIEGGRMIWKQVRLMEDAMMIHRIMRAPERRIFKVDVGNIPPAEVEQHMQRIINETKKQPYLDRDTGQYDLKYNLNNMMEDYYLPVRGGQSSTNIETLSGMEWTGIDDINYLKEKMFAALKVPKAFLGFEEGVEGKATLAAQDVRFARTIERIQKILVSELTKIAIVHLYSQGYNDEDLTNFELHLTNSSTIHEQEQIELWNSKVALADNLKSNKMLSENWIYENVWKMSKEDVAKQRANIVEDSKTTFRIESIQTQGMDPKNPPKSATEGPSEDEMAAAQASVAGDEEMYKKEEPVDQGGRPKEGPKAGRQDSARGADPLGKDTKNRDVKNRDRTTTIEERRYIAKTLFQKRSSDKGMLNEDNLLTEV